MSLPVLEAAPGMPGHLVKRASSAPIDLPPPTRRHGYVQPAAPHAFRLRCNADVALETGDTLFTVLELYQGTVHRVRTTTQLEYLPRDAALELAESLIDKLEQAGFAALEKLDRKACLDLAHEHEQVRIAEHKAPFGTGAWRAETWLRVAVRAGTMAEKVMRMRGDGCLVTLVVADPTLGPS